MKTFQTVLEGVAVVLVAGAALAQDIPLNNWIVPAYRTSGAAGGLSTMADVTPGIAFVGVAPCRLVDTRQAGFPAGYGTPPLAAGVPRNFDLNSDPLCTGIPAGVEAYSLNFTVTNVQGPGFLKVFPEGGAIPADISTLNYIPGNNTANAAIVPAGTGGGITVISGVSGTDLIIDINGYFSDSLNLNVSLAVFTAANGFAAILGNNSSNSNGSHGIGGFAGGAGVVHGVQGQISGSALGGSSGVHGIANGNVNIAYGVLGETFSTSAGSAGVQGVDSSGSPAGATGVATGGVRGLSSEGWGVIGISAGNGAVLGVLLNGGGVPQANGYLGRSGADSIGCGGIVEPACPPDWAVYGLGDIGATGTKFFLDPHPTDPSKVIGYISLEGPEAGTYFRGRARFQNGVARIAVPEHFRMVTDPEGLTVQITPIGGMATVGVLRVDLNEIIVQSSRNLEFSYLVQGVRATFKDIATVWQGNEFRPESADAKIPAAFSEGQRTRLIANGTYNADGTVNMETARRLGWDRIWEKRNPPVPAPNPE